LKSSGRARRRFSAAGAASSPGCSTATGNPSRLA
jgi:hypothetical protein